MPTEHPNVVLSRQHFDLMADQYDEPPSVSRATPLASPLAVLPYGACPAPE
jgi:hypothetical protein